MSNAQPFAIGETNRHPAIVILDFGSQYSELIARRVRETEVFSLVMSHSTSAEEIRAINPKGIILSGGPSSVYAEHAPQCDSELWNLGIPVLGVCYGMQLMVQQLGGSVVAAGRAEYGKAPLYVDDPTDLLTNVDEASTMWMSHGDSVERLPDGFVRLAHTDNTPEAAVADHSRRLYGVQFHPEVVHSVCGMALLRNFVYHICGCVPDWTTDAFIDEAVADVRAQVGDKRVLLALSGGVDSSTLAFLLHKAIGDQLTCMFIDQGFMRKGEPEFLMDFFDKKFHIRVEYINARERFISKLAGVTDPEEKRKLIGTEFIRVFEEESKRLGPFDYLAQGTLYPDVIESAGTNVDPKTRMALRAAQLQRRHRRAFPFILGHGYHEGVGTRQIEHGICLQRWPHGHDAGKPVPRSLGRSHRQEKGLLPVVAAHQLRHAGRCGQRIIHTTPAIQAAHRHGHWRTPACDGGRGGGTFQ